MKTLENMKLYSENDFFSRAICILLRILNVSFTAQIAAQKLAVCKTFYCIAEKNLSPVL